MLPRLILAAVALTLAGAAPAAADSIAYIQNGDIWLATPDGARKQQVTHTGTYYYVSQADDGTMAALVPGERIQKLSRTGQVLADFPTYVSDGAPVGGAVTQFHGPFDPEISPDGSKIAFEYFNDTYDADAGLQRADRPALFRLHAEPGRRHHQRDGLHRRRRLRAADRLGRPALDVQRHAAALEPRREPQRRRGLHAASAADHDDHWFYDPNQGLGVEDVELSRDLQTVVGIAGFYRREAARVPDDDVAVRRPGLGPHAVHEQGQRPGRRSSATSCRASSRTPRSRRAARRWPTAPPRASSSPRSRTAARPAVPERWSFPGAKHPDWGPADVPPASAFESTGGSGSGTGQQTGKPGASKQAHAGRHHAPAR